MRVSFRQPNLVGLHLPIDSVKSTGSSIVILAQAVNLVGTKVTDTLTFGDGMMAVSND